MKSLSMNYCFSILVAFLFFIPLSGMAQGHLENPDYYNYSMKEADAVIKLKPISVKIDGCKNCVSEGNLYIVKCEVIKVFFNKKKKIAIKSPFYYMISGGSIMILDKHPKTIIAFIAYHDPHGRRYYVPAKTAGVYWYADMQVIGEDADAPEIEKLIERYKSNLTR